MTAIHRSENNSSFGAGNIHARLNIRDAVDMVRMTKRQKEKKKLNSLADYLRGSVKF